MRRAPIRRRSTDPLWARRPRVGLGAVLIAIAVLFPAITPLPGAARTPFPASGETAQADGAERQEPTLSSGRVTCREAPKVFELLCTAYELITSDHVDTFKDQSLATAAAEQVRKAGHAQRTDGTPPACPLPAPEFEEMCVAIDDVNDTAAAVEMAIRGMARSLDSNSYYLTIEQYERFRTGLENMGTSGLGVAFGLIENGNACLVVSATCRPVITEVYPGSPADAAGLMMGDVLVEMGDTFPAELACEDFARLGEFPSGEEVAVRVRRGDETVTATIRAADLAIPVARGRVVDGNIGHLRLDVFSTFAADAVAEVLRQLTDQTISGLVLDLRGTPGGYVDSAVGTAGLFLPNLSTIVHLVGRDKVETVRARRKEVAPDPIILPMVVVVDSLSASASELITGALRDHKRATVVGETTYGKSTGQSSYHLELEGTLVGVLHLTTIRWFTPSSLSVAEGIKPDVEMDLPSCLLPAEVARRAISAVRPHVADVAVTSRPLNGDTYTPGQAVTVTVTFTSPVVVNRNDASPRVRIQVGEESRSALYKSGTGTTGLVFEYTVAPGDVDPDGISITADSFRPGGARIGLPAGLDAFLTHDAVAPDPQHRVGATEPISPVDSDALFTDIQGNVHRENIERIAKAGITVGCSSPDSNRFCPDRGVTRAQMATFVARALNLPEPTRDYFIDDDGTTHEESINRLAEAGITQGCNVADDNRFCPDQVVTRAQMATFLARALDLAPGSASFTDIGDSPHRANIERVAAAGITQSCNPPENDRFCPGQVVTRAQMATFLGRVLALLAAV